ncbi:MAG TPA: relaxase MobL [[Clostridium] spiroforme]|uniref:Relaxase MobL n=1 Tax=Thomasclavelia spiroformis TaxID=29348 RepID=A0A921GCK4_9FIRM|nr:relaxase MobL [Thomasclavelia spiroformis]
MSQLIVKWRYLGAHSKTNAKNLIKYIAKREGVEFTDECWRGKKVTKYQEELIKQLINDFPSAINSEEYKVYFEKQTRGAASDLITQTLDYNLDMAAKRENYVDYIAHRPGVETYGKHGLFSDVNVPVDNLDRIANRIANQKDNVHTYIISLSREDAVRLGYDNAENWMGLIRENKMNFAKALGIPYSDLEWYGAFHNESYHPHVHLVMFSKNQKAFITKDRLENLKMNLSRQIFAGDRIEIYKEQNKLRSQMSETVKDKIDLLISSINNGKFQNDNIEKTLIELSKLLENYKGKTVYGYLPQPMKKKINFIIDELEKDENISELYNLWCKYNDKIIEMYQQTKAEYIPLSQNKTFKPLKNIIIREALNICMGNISFNDVLDENDEPVEEEYSGKTFYETHPGLYEYQMAKRHLDASAESCDLNLGIQYLMQSADIGYEYALYKLGKFYISGKFVKKDLHKAEELLAKASNMNNCYAQFSLAKLYLDTNSGLFDSKKGLYFLFKSASGGYKFALYQLGKIYYKGQYVEKDIKKAKDYFNQAIEKDCKCAEKLLEYINNNSKEWQSYTAVLAVLNDLSKLFKKEFDNKYKFVQRVDRKMLQRINEKKQALGLRINKFD